MRVRNTGFRMNRERSWRETRSRRKKEGRMKKKFGSTTIIKKGGKDGFNISDEV